MIHLFRIFIYAFFLSYQIWCFASAVEELFEGVFEDVVSEGAEGYDIPGSPYTGELTLLRSLIPEVEKTMQFSFLAEGGGGKCFRAYKLGAEPLFVKLADRGLKREAEIMRKLQGTPGVINLMTYREDLTREKELLLTDFVENDIKNIDYSDSKEVYQLAFQVLETLKIAHGKGITHRDIKLSNLLKRKGGRYFVADWGIAATADHLKIIKDNHMKLKVKKARLRVLEQVLDANEVDKAKKHTSSPLKLDQTTLKAIRNEYDEIERNISTYMPEGTPSFLAPEAYHSPYRYGPPNDIWSLGIVLARLLVKDPWVLDRKRSANPNLNMGLLENLGKMVVFRQKLLDEAARLKKSDLRRSILLKTVADMLVINPDKRKTSEQLFRELEKHKSIFRKIVKKKKRSTVKKSHN